MEKANQAMLLQWVQGDDQADALYLFEVLGACAGDIANDLPE